jgi:hypothetical protein
MRAATLPSGWQFVALDAGVTGTLPSTSTSASVTESAPESCTVNTNDGLVRPSKPPAATTTRVLARM